MHVGRADRGRLNRRQGRDLPQFVAVLGSGAAFPARSAAESAFEGQEFF
jgi:hypothetical protein